MTIKNNKHLNMKTTIFLAAIITASTTFTSCKKDTKEPAPTPAPIPEVTTGSLKVEFEPMVGTEALVMGTKTYTNAAGNTFNVTTWKYYISNVKLTKTDNSVVTISDSYFLVDQSSASGSLIEIKNVPFGDYKAISFVLGVDSTRNVSGAQTGALDPANGMFWTWSSGYIMAKMEGTSPQSPDVANKLTFHIGGFSGANSSLKNINIGFNTDVANVSKTITPKAHLTSNLLEWFTSPNAVDFATLYKVHMPGNNAKVIADNYADMFTFEHIHN
jgi:hypothetical protein